MVERFYTNSKGQKDLVDQIEIYKTKKEYVLLLKQPDYITDGQDEFGEDIASIYVSRFIFDVIVKGVKENNFFKSKMLDDNFL